MQNSRQLEVHGNVPEAGQDRDLVAADHQQDFVLRLPLLVGLITYAKNFRRSCSFSSATF